MEPGSPRYNTDYLYSADDSIEQGEDVQRALLEQASYSNNPRSTDNRPVFDATRNTPPVPEPIMTHQHQGEDTSGAAELVQRLEELEPRLHTRLLYRAALVYPGVMDMIKGVCQQKNSCDRETFQRYTTDATSLLYSNNEYDFYDEQGKQEALLALATKIEWLILEIAKTITGTLPQPYRVKVEGLNAIRRIIRTILDTSQKGHRDFSAISDDLIGSGHMVGWEKHILRVCEKLNNPDDKTLLASTTVPAGDTGSVEMGYLEDFAFFVDRVVRQIYKPGRHSKAAKELERALSMIGGTALSARVTQARGRPVKIRIVETHNPSGLSVVPKR